MVDRDPFAEHVKHVKTIEAVGISPPPDWAKVHVRLTDFLQLKTPTRDRLVDAIVEGDGDVVALRAMAYAETVVQPAVNRSVIAGVHNKLRQIYSGHARKNHQKLAEQFNAAAREFTAAAGIVDADTDATMMVDAPEDQRLALPGVRY